MNGIQVAKNIYGFSPETHFIFITGYAQYAIESFAVHPYDYILKPVKKDRVNEVISSLADKIERKKDAGADPGKIKIKTGNEIFMIAVIHAYKWVIKGKALDI